MEIKTIVVGPLQTNCYILTKNKQTLIIDPGDEPNKIINEINKEVIGILITHYHFDHIGALNTIKEKYTEHTEWHTILCWNQLAKRVEQYIRKGCRVYIEGKIRTRSYEDKKGITRYFTEINAEKIDIVSFPSSIRPIEGKDAPSVPNTNQ